MKSHFLILISGFLLPFLSLGQTSFPQTSHKPSDLPVGIQPMFAFQLWTYYSHGQSIYNPSSDRYEPVDNRFVTNIRRSRLGLKIEPVDQLMITIVGAMDQVGKDVLDAAVGGSNNGSAPKLRVLNAFLQWHISKKHDLLHLSGGYFVPQMGRESLTSAFGVSSMEKAFTQNYIRRHLVGNGSGRATGINLGGQYLTASQQLGINYNIGLFTPLSTAYQGNSYGNQASPLLTGRLLIYVGDPELATYKLGGIIQHFGKRRGLSLGISAAHQGHTDLFQYNTAQGIDFLFNWDHLNLDGEWMWMQRSGERELENNQMRVFTYQSQAGHVRIAYHVVLGNQTILEPTFLLSRFQGGLQEELQKDALAIKASSGIDQTYDIGLNWYLRQEQLTIGLHYTWRHGHPGGLDPGSNINLYYYQSGAGAMQRGNWLGIGLIAKM